MQRVALCVGPGNASKSGNLSLLAVRPGVQSLGTTWRAHDARVMRVRDSMRSWSRLCTSCSKTFGRGVNRTFLAKAYREHGVIGCPRIMAPTKVRMIVYCGQYLSQSLRHHGVRVAAMKMAIGRLIGAKDKESSKKLARLRSMARVLCSRTLLLPLLLNDLLHVRSGYQSGCVTLQTTQAVFFKLHLASAQMWWQLMFFGASQWERYHLVHRICFGHRASMQEAERTFCFKCRFCGLFSPSGKAMHAHVVTCHPYSKQIYRRQIENYEAWRMFRPKLQPLSSSFVLSNHDVGADPFAGLALRQPGVIVTGMEVTHAYLKFFAHLLTFVDWAGSFAANPQRERQGISLGDWIRVANLSCWVPSHVRRSSPNFWRAVPEALLTDTFRGVPLSADVAKGQGHRISLQEVCRKRNPKQIYSAAEHLCLVVQAGQSFMHELGCTHESAVVYSHGDHIPLSVRNAAVVAFWLPDVLDVAFEKMSSREAKAFWDPRVDAFLEVADYVAKRMRAYRWPDHFELKTQYRDLLLHWARLCRRNEVRQLVLCKRDSAGKQPAGIAAAGCLEDERARVGNLEHGADLVKAGLEFRYVFEWETFWQMVHTGRLPSGAVLDFVPDAYMAAFCVWHFSGMFGTSEAHAESIGSILKRYAKSVSTSRVIESSILRAHGLTGCGGGSEDAFLEICWAHFFRRHRCLDVFISVSKFQEAAKAVCGRRRFEDLATVRGSSWRSRTLVTA